MRMCVCDTGYILLIAAINLHRQPIELSAAVHFLRTSSIRISGGTRKHDINTIEEWNLVHRFRYTAARLGFSAEIPYADTKSNAFHQL